MTEFPVDEYADFETFTREWEHDDETTTKLIWQLLGELSDDELLIKLTAWVADEKVGYTESSTPTAFVGQIEGESEKAIRFADATAAKPLARLAHRMASLRDGLETTEPGDERQDWLENRLDDKRKQFQNREDMVGLQEEWLPKSQILAAVRRTQ